MNSDQILNNNTLDHYLVDNDIFIVRLRATMLMKDQKPISINKMNEMMLAYINENVCSYLTKYPFYHNRKHKALSYMRDEHGRLDAVKKVYLNKLHGKKKKDVKWIIKQTKEKFLKQFELWNSMCGKNVLYVCARQGGLNRIYYPIDTTHPMYLADVDDAYDRTYCDIYYDLTKAK